MVYCILDVYRSTFVALELGVNLGRLTGINPSVYGWLHVREIRWIGNHSTHFVCPCQYHDVAQVRSRLKNVWESACFKIKFCWDLQLLHQITSQPIFWRIFSKVLYSQTWKARLILTFLDFFFVTAATPSVVHSLIFDLYTTPLPWDSMTSVSLDVWTTNRDADIKLPDRLHSSRWYVRTSLRGLSGRHGWRCSCSKFHRHFRAGNSEDMRLPNHKNLFRPTSIHTDVRSWTFSSSTAPKRMNKSADDCIWFCL